MLKQKQDSKMNEANLPELLVFQKLGQVHLGLGLVNHHVVSACHSHNINIFCLLLLHAQRPLANADCDPIVGNRIAILQWLQVEVLLVVVDHLLKFPVWVGGIPSPPPLLLHHSRCLHSSSSVSRHLSNMIVNKKTYIKYTQKVNISI